jgi:hypothetical protein
MVLTLGTNCGFVTAAPDGDPEDFANQLDTQAKGLKVTAPGDILKVTEIGWYCDNATEEANFEVGMFTHDAGNDRPDAAIGSISRTNAKGTTSGWKRVTGLNIDMSSAQGNTVWIAVQLDDTATTTNTNLDPTVGERFYYMSSQTTMPDPWGAGTSGNNALIAFYAVYEAEAPAGIENVDINIGDVWKDVESIQINVCDDWKTVTKIEINIGDAWKAVYSA